MLKNGVYVLKENTTVFRDLNLKKNQEIEVVNTVLYMEGYKLPNELQGTISSWMGNNLNLFKLDNRNF